MRDINWRNIFADKGIDLVMVILGITIAFQLENWRSHSEQKNSERFYLQSLLADVNADIVDIRFIIDNLEGDKKSVEKYLPVMYRQPADSLLQPVTDIISLETFMGHQNTYQTLIASSDVNSISNQEVVRLMMDFYSKYVSIRRFETVYTNAIFEMNRHFAGSMIYDQRKLTDPSVRDMPLTRNYLVIAISQLNNGIEDYREALETAEALKKAIEGSL